MQVLVVLLALVALTFAQAPASVPGGCCMFTEDEYKGEMTCTNSSLGFNLEVKIKSYFCDRAYSAAFFDKANLNGDPIELVGCGDEVPTLLKPMAVNSVAIGPCQRVSCCFYSAADFTGAEYCVSTSAPAPVKEELAEVQKEAKWKSLRCNPGNAARLTHSSGFLDVPCGGELKPTSQFEFTAITATACGSNQAIGDEVIDGFDVEQINVDQALTAEQIAFDNIDAILPVDDALPVDQALPTDDLFVDQAISADPALDQIFGVDQAVGVDQALPVVEEALPVEQALPTDFAVVEEALPIDQALPVDQALPLVDDGALPSDLAVAADLSLDTILPIDDGVLPLDDAALPTDQAVADVPDQEAAIDDLLFDDDAFVEGDFAVADSDDLADLDLTLVDTFDQAVSEDPVVAAEAIAADQAVADVASDFAVVDVAVENVAVDSAVSSDFVNVEDALAADQFLADQAVADIPVSDFVSVEDALAADLADLALAEHAVADFAMTDSKNSALSVSVSLFVVLASIFATLL